MSKSLSLIASAALVAALGCTASHEGHDHGDHEAAPASGPAATAAPAEEDAYPLTTCVVSGEPLGAMGEPHVIQWEGRTVKFCCPG